MSRTIDERIVQMTFENDDFERNAKQTISTLGKLRNATNDSAISKNFGKSLSELEAYSRGFNLTGITGAFQSVTDSINLFETIAVGALLRIGQQAADTGIRIVKSLSVDQIYSGWVKYAEIIQSQQTIMSAVSDKINAKTGELYNIDDIVERINKLQWYTDETSYNISQMTNAIGTFTSSGVDLDVATEAIIGIANACADAGVSTEKAEHAFYGFSKAIGSGNMSLSIWNNQLRTSGLTNSERFKQSLLDAGVAAGTLVKVSDGLYKTTKATSKSGVEVTLATMLETFSDTKWANADVMLKTLSSYADTVDRVFDMANSDEYSTASEAIAALTDEYIKAGKEVPKSLAAFTRAQEAVSFSQAIQSVKDAVSTKWSKTFELIFGNYEEAKTLWTTLANEMWEWFAAGGDERNDLLTQWHEGLSEFEKQLESGNIDKLEDQVKAYEEKIKNLTTVNPIAKAITSEQSQAKMFSAMLTRDAQKIGESVVDIYTEYGKLADIPYLDRDKDLKNTLTGILEEREKILSREKDETKQLEIIEEYNRKIGEVIKSSNKYEITGYNAARGYMKDSEKRLSVYQSLYNSLKGDKIDSKAIESLIKDKDSLKIIQNLLKTNASDLPGIMEAVSTSAKDIQKIGDLETAQAAVEGLFDAVENKDSSKLISLWKENYETFYDALSGDFPKKIMNLQTEINNLGDSDIFTKKINELKESLEGATDYSKTSIEKQISFYEALSDSIKSDSIIDFYKNNKKSFEEYFNDVSDYKDIFTEINTINRDSNLTEAEKTFKLLKQYELLQDLVKEQSKLDEQTEKQKELEKELVDYFIEGKSGYEYFIDAVKKGLSGITGVINAIRDGFKNVFPMISAIGLIDLTHQFSDFIDKIVPSEEKLEKISSLFEYIFGLVKKLLSPLSVFLSIGKLILNILDIVWGTFIVPLVTRLKPIYERLTDIVELVSGALSKSIDRITSNLDPVQRFFLDLLNAMEPIIRVIQKAIEKVHEFIDSWSKTEDGMVNDSIFVKVADIISRAFKIIDQLITGAKPLFTFVKETLGKGFSYIAKVVKDLYQTLENAFGENNLNFSNILSFFILLQQFFSGSWEIEKMSDRFSWFEKIFGKGSIFNKIFGDKGILASISDTLFNFSSQMEAYWNEAFTKSLKNISLALLAISVSVLILASIKEENLNRALNAIYGISALFGALMLLIKVLSTSKNVSKIVSGNKTGGILGFLGSFFGLGGIGYFVESLTTTINATAMAINIGSIVTALLVIAGALKMVSSINPETLGSSMLALLLMLGAVYAFISGIYNLEKKKISIRKLTGSSSMETGLALRGIGKVVEQIAIGMLIIAAALKLTSSIQPLQLVFGVAALGVMLIAIGFFIKMLQTIEVGKTTLKNPLKGIGKTFEQIAVGLLIISAALKLMSTMKPDQIVNVVAALGFVLLEIYLFMLGMAKVNSGLGKGTKLTSIAASLLILSGAIAVIVGAITVMAMIPVEALSKSVKFLALALGMIWLFFEGMASMNAKPGTLISISAAMLVFSASLGVLALALAAIGMIDSDTLYSSLFKIAAIMAVIGLLSAVFSSPAIIGGMLAFSAAFIAIGAGIYLIMSGISKLLPLLEILAVQGRSVGAGIQQAIITTFETILGLVPDFIIALVAAIAEFVILLLVAISDKLGILIDGLGHILIVVCNTLAEWIRGNAYGVGEALGNLARALIEGLLDALKGAVSGLITPWLEDLVNSLTGGEYSLEDITAGIAKKMGGPTKEAGQQVSKDLASGIEESAPVAVEASDQLGAQAAEAMESKEEAEEAAKETVNGLVDYITNPAVQEYVGDAFSKLGKTGIKYFDDYLGIQSPSKVMADKGKFTVLGLIEGVYKNLGLVNGAGRDAADMLLNAMSYAAENAESILEEDFNPVITPVLDMSNIEANSGRISSLLNSDASYNAAILASQSNSERQNQNGVQNPISINVGFTINQAGKDLTEADFTKFGKQIANIVNDELGKMVA